MSTFIEKRPAAPIPNTYVIEFTEDEIVHLRSLVGRHGGESLHRAFQGESEKANDSAYTGIVAAWRAGFNPGTPGNTPIPTSVGTAGLFPKKGRPSNYPA